MSERLLCDQQLRVSVDGGGTRTLLVVADTATIRFWTETVALEETLRGETVQLSALGGYCRIEPHGDRIHLEFGLQGLSRKRCDFPASELANALAYVRSLETPQES